jgi:hypothetical protein
MAFFSLFAMGRYLHVAGKTYGVPLPTALLEYIPFLSNIRTPSRAIVYVYLFLAVATALSFKQLLFSEQKYLLNRSRSLRQIILVLLSSFIFLDFYPGKLDSTKVECPLAYETIRDDPSPTFGVADLPNSYVNANRYMMYQMCHEKPIVFAMTSRKLKPSLSDYLEIEASNIQKQQLARNFVKYIVVHKEFISDRFDVEAYRQYYHAIHDDQRNVVFQVY